jgi:hypothetical protein
MTSLAEEKTLNGMSEVQVSGDEDEEANIHL